MSPRLRSALTYGGSVVLGGGLLYLALRSVDFGGVGEALRTAAYGWLLPLAAVTLAAHGLRAWRWRLLLDVLPEERPGDATAAPRASTRQAFYATMIGYMVNQAAPRLGEPARAANLAARTRHSFPAVFGTVVVERLIDMATLAVAIASVLVAYWSELGALLAEFATGAEALTDGLRARGPVLALLGVVALLTTLGVAWWWRRREAAAESRVGALLGGFGEGLRTLLQVRAKAGVLAATVGIWFGYALMAYIPLQMLGLAGAFGLSLLDAWALVALGAIGMALPAPGGTGSYHYAIIATMTLLLGVPETPAATYALLTHAVQLVFLVLVGFLCLLAQGTRRPLTGEVAPPSPKPTPSSVSSATSP